MLDRVTTGNFGPPRATPMLAHVGSFLVVREHFVSIRASLIGV